MDAAERATQRKLLDQCDLFERQARITLTLVNLLCDWCEEHGIEVPMPALGPNMTLDFIESAVVGNVAKKLEQFRDAKIAAKEHDEAARQEQEEKDKAAQADVAAVAQSLAPDNGHAAPADVTPLASRRTGRQAASSD